jgi:uncharacterized protein (UPF0303 family)
MSPAEHEAHLASLLDEEARLQFDRFTNDDAWRLGVRLVETARAEGLAVTVDIRRHGQQLFHAALSGTAADNDEWVIRKTRVVDRFGHSSYYVGSVCRAKGESLGEAFLLDEREYAAHGGCFPVIVRDVGVVGTVTVSGLPQVEDHRLVVRVLTEHLAAGPA